MLLGRVGLGLIVLVVLAGTAAAGSRENPDVVDAAEDGLDEATAQANANANTDVLAAWFAERTDAFSVHVRVRDLPVAMRQGSTAQVWTVTWAAGGESYAVEARRPALGDATAVVRRGATSVAADVRFDLARDEVVVDVPRTLAFGSTSTTFPSGTTFHDPWVSAAEDRPEGPGIRQDRTAPGRAFTFGHVPAANPWLVVDPRTPVVSVRRGQTADVPFDVATSTGLDVGATLRFTLDGPDGWRLLDTAQEIALPTGKVATARVVAPQLAGPGEGALVTVLGGAFPVSALVVVVDDVGASEVVAAAEAALAPHPPEPVGTAVRPWPLHLHGSTQAASDRPPLHTGLLVETTPEGAATERVEHVFTNQNGPLLFPLGAWESEPLGDATNLTGVVRADAWFTWTGVTGLRLRALVGVAPLPLDWDGGAPPPGAVELATLGASAVTQTTTPVQLAAESTLGGHRLSAGDRLAVALYGEKTGGTGTVALHLFGRDTPTRLVARLEEPVLPPMRASAYPLAKVATFGAGLRPASGADALAGLTATLVPPEGPPQALALTATFETPRVGNATDKPGTRTIQGQPFAKTLDDGVSRRHAFTIGPAARSVEIRLAGEHATDLTDDTDLDLVVRRVDGAARTFAQASSAPGPVERIVLDAAELARFGAGTYEAEVVLDRSGPTAGTQIDYDVVVVQHDGVDAPSYVAGRFVWSFADHAKGDYALDVRLDDGRGAPQTMRTVYRLTDVGPTRAPFADFSFAPGRPVSGQIVNFTDLSSDADGVLSRWRWDFGDGTTAATRNATHAYAAPGAYDVTLAVTDDLNATSVSVTRQVEVANAPPVVVIRAEPPLGIAGQRVRFTDASYDPDGNVSTRSWTFGDGDVSTEPVVEKVFAAPGTYNVTLRVFDAPLSVPAGVAATRAYVVVEAGAAEAPVPDFEPPYGPVVGRAARFQDASFWPEGPLERRWDFGDGGVSSEESPLHTYASPGEYAVTLTVFPSGRQDLTASVTKNVLVAASSGVAATFVVEPAEPTTGDVVRLRDLTSALGPATSRHWDLGDGTTTAGANATHVYPRPGTYTVKLTVTAPDGGLATAERRITVARGAADSPAPPSAPLAGTLVHYRGVYDAGVEHRESYAGAWRAAELEGRLGTYLEAPGAHVLGTATAEPPRAEWEGGGLRAANPAGALATYLAAEAGVVAGEARVRNTVPVAAALGSRPVDLSALATADPGEDDASDGVVVAESALEGGGLRVRRAVTLVEGALHADVRTEMQGAPDDPMRFATETALAAPEGSWVATWDGDAVRAFPLEGAAGQTFDLGGYPNRWFAVYSPSTRDVAGVVVSGDVSAITLDLSAGELVVRADHVGLGRVLAAEYLVAYRVGTDGATRYAGVMDLARQESEEVGFATLAPGRAAAAAWAASGADLDVDASRGLAAFWGKATGTPAEWTVRVSSDASDDGKSVRLVLPSALLDEGTVEVLLDGVALSTLEYEALAGDGTLVLNVPIASFSTHVLTVRHVVPGLPEPFLWLALAVGAVVGGGATVAARSRWPRAPARTPPPGAPAPGLVEESAELAFKTALLRRLQTPGGAVRFEACATCGGPVRFGATDARATCERCGAENARPQEGP